MGVRDPTLLLGSDLRLAPCVLEGDEEVKVFIRCVPPMTTSQQKRIMVRNGKPMFFKGKKQVAQENSIAVLLAPHQPSQPLDMPCELELFVVYPPLKKHTSSKAKAAFFDDGNLLWCVSKPDLDNFAKGVVDELARQLWVTDDKLICSMILRKAHGKNSGILIKLHPLDSVPMEEFE